MRGRLWAIVAMVALGGLGALLAAVPLTAKNAKSAAALPSGNLVKDGGAEAGLSGWTKTHDGSTFEVVLYGAPHTSEDAFGIVGGFPGRISPPQSEGDPGSSRLAHEIQRT